LRDAFLAGPISSDILLTLLISRPLVAASGRSYKSDSDLTLGWGYKSTKPVESKRSPSFKILVAKVGTIRIYLSRHKPDCRTPTAAVSSELKLSRWEDLHRYLSIHSSALHERQDESMGEGGGGDPARFHS